MISLLCVDGKSGAIDHISQDLERTGDFAVTTSCSGEEALMSLKKRSFDAILSAGEMPGMKGVDLLHAARENGCHAPFIFFDGFDDTNRRPESHGDDETTNLIAGFIRAVGDSQRPDQTPDQVKTRFRAIADRAGAGIQVHRNGDLVYANHAAEEITGCRREELQATDHRDLVPPAEREKARVRRHLEGALPTERYVLRILHKNGSERAIEVTADICLIREIPAPVLSLNAHLIRGSDGSACGIGGTLRDITDRQQGEEELRRSKALFAATIEATKDGILATDRDGQPIACNRIFRMMWGVPETCPVPGDGRALLDMIAAHLKDPDETYSLVKDTCKRPDRTQHGVLECTDGRTIEYFTRPQTIGGEATGRVWSFSDITRRKEAERNLQERESFSATLLEAIRDGVLILREDGTVRYANRAACELVGLPSAGDCVGRNILDFVHQDSVHAVFRDLLSVRGGSGAVPAEYTFVTSTGRVRQVEGLSSTITWKEKRSIAVTLRDITERKQAEAAAQESADLNRALIDGLPEYIVVLTQEGEITFANPAAEAASGCAPGALTGKTLRSFIVESSLQDFDTAIQDARTRQKRRSFEIGIMTVTDECVQVTMRAVPITFRNQEATLVLMTDLTERLILEKELEYHAEELKRYSESLARTNEKLTIMNCITRHDILNQLTVLLGYLEIAAEESKEPAVLESLERVKFSAQNIREQLEFARDYQDIGVREPQ
jgi:PAS domain S-box-containing protein